MVCMPVSVTAVDVFTNCCTRRQSAYNHATIIVPTTCGTVFLCSSNGVGAWCTCPWTCTWRNSTTEFDILPNKAATDRTGCGGTTGQIVHIGSIIKPIDSLVWAEREQVPAEISEGDNTNELT
jgi:hypothetical protein